MPLLAALLVGSEYVVAACGAGHLAVGQAQLQFAAGGLGKNRLTVRAHEGARPDLALALGVLYANLSDGELEDLMRFVKEHTPGQRDQVLRAFRNALMHTTRMRELSQIASLRLPPLRLWSFPTATLSPMHEAAEAGGGLARYVVIETPDGNTTAMVLTSSPL
ncbi:MAG: hypothetical protein ACR2JU_05080 [Nocardioidaceae bacterium]